MIKGFIYLCVFILALIFGSKGISDLGIILYDWLFEEEEKDE